MKKDNTVVYNKSKLTKVWYADKDKTVKKFKSLELLMDDFNKFTKLNERRVLRGKEETKIEIN